MQTKTTTTTTPAPKPDAQPVQAAYTAEDYHSARVESSYATAAEIAEELARSPGLAPSIRAFRHLARAARMRAKAQPVQAVSSTPETDAAQFFLPNAIGRVAGIVSVTLAQQLERQRNALQSALETIHEAGRMSDQPRAVYCSLIAHDALTAAGNQEYLKARGTKREALLAALEQCLPYVDRIRAMSGGDGDLTALTARAALNAARGGAQ